MAFHSENARILTDVLERTEERHRKTTAHVRELRMSSRGGLDSGTPR
jgi:hypothetical protein